VAEETGRREKQQPVDVAEVGELDDRRRDQLVELLGAFRSARGMPM